MDVNFSVRSRLTNDRKSLNVTVVGGATESLCGTRAGDSRFFESPWEMKISWSWSNWVDWGKGNHFCWSYRELRQMEDPSNRDSIEVKTIKVFTRFTFFKRITKIKRFQVSQFVFIPEFSPFDRVNENPRL